jgi:hypothetical protein
MALGKTDCEETMKGHVFGGLKLQELALKTWREFNKDNGFGKAAELAY